MASLPFTSILAFVWIYLDTKDTNKIGALSTSIFWLVIPSLVFFILLPVLLKSGVKFYFSLLLASLATAAIYAGYVRVLGAIGLKI